MFSCFAKLRQELSNLLASQANWVSDPASSCQNCSSVIATALISLMNILYVFCFSLENLNWIFCTSKVNTALLYDPQYPKALMEDLPKPQNEISKVKTEEERCADLLSNWHLLCLLNKARGGAIFLLLRVTTVIAMAPENAWLWCMSRQDTSPNVRCHIIAPQG